MPNVMLFSTQLVNNLSRDGQNVLAGSHLSNVRQTWNRVYHVYHVYHVIGQSENKLTRFYVCCYFLRFYDFLGLMPNISIDN